jgi:hypothetical protein
LCYARRHAIRAIPPCPRRSAAKGTAAIRPRNDRAAYAASPHSRPFRAILNCGLGECASHVRTDRPHPAPNGAGLARAALRPPVASLQSRGFTPHAPVRGAFALPATHDGGFASRHHSGAIPPLKTRTRAIAPLTTRRRLSRPGTHDQSLRALDNAQAAFMPLHPDRVSSR